MNAQVLNSMEREHIGNALLERYRGEDADWLGELLCEVRMAETEQALKEVFERWNIGI